MRYLAGVEDVNAESEGSTVLKPLPDNRRRHRRMRTLSKAVPVPGLEGP